MDFTLYHAAMEADRTWQNALEAKFGKNAGTMRYKPEGKAGELAPLAAAKRATDELWLDEMRKHSGSPFATTNHAL